MRWMLGWVSKVAADVFEGMLCVVLHLLWRRPERHWLSLLFKRLPDSGVSVLDMLMRSVYAIESSGGAAGMSGCLPPLASCERQLGLTGMAEPS